MAAPAYQMSEMQAKLNMLKQVDAVTSFVPNAGGQELFVQSKAHEIILAGGNSAGKTWCGLMMCALHIVPELDKNGNPTGKTIHPHIDLRIPPNGREGWISSYSSDSQRDTLRPVIDKILGPYIVADEKEDGVYKRLYFRGMTAKGRSWINMKWQKQGPRSYAGPKKNFVYMDEPHMKAIYREASARLFRSGGHMWTCLTPVVDEDSPVRSQDIIWMRDNIVEPWQRHPENFPLRQVIYMDVEENYSYLDGDFIDDMLAGMSAQERAIRKSGLFILFAGRNAFDKQMLLDLLSYLEEHEEESTPTFGDYFYSAGESDKWKVEYEQNSRIDFPDKPQSEWTHKMWERHVDGEGLQHCPGYIIGVDVAEGVPGGDYTSATVLRNDNKRMVAALHGHITEEELAKQLWLMGHYYNSGTPDYRPAELAIEIRNFGAATQRYLIHGSAELGIPKYPFSSLYQRSAPSDIDKNIGYAYAPGWDTNARTRKYVITAMREAIVLAHRAIKSGRQCTIADIGVIKEAREFVQDKNGKYQGHPDDRLFSLGIGHVVLGHGSFEYDHSESEEKEEVVEGDANWLLKEDGDTGLLTVQFNYDSIVDQIVNPTPSELQF